MTGNCTGVSFIPDRKISTGSCSDSGIEVDDEISRPVSQNSVTQEVKNQMAVNTER